MNRESITRSAIRDIPERHKNSILITSACPYKSQISQSSRIQPTNSAFSSKTLTLKAALSGHELMNVNTRFVDVQFAFRRNVN